MSISGDIDLLKCICKRCGHSWIRRSIELPKICPKCKSPYWNKERRITQAERLYNLLHNGGKSIDAPNTKNEEGKVSEKEKEESESEQILL